MRPRRGDWRPSAAEEDDSVSRLEDGEIVPLVKIREPPANRRRPLPFNADIGGGGCSPSVPLPSSDNPPPIPR